MSGMPGGSHTHKFRCTLVFCVIVCCQNANAFVLNGRLLEQNRQFTLSNTAFCRYEVAPRSDSEDSGSEEEEEDEVRHPSYSS